MKKKHEILATEVLGNTNQTSVAFNARHFQLTLNQPEKYNSLKDYLMSKRSIRYFLAGKEKGSLTEHEHIHIYANYSRPVKLNKKYLEGAHVEVCYGSPKQNIEYIKKPDTEIIDEIGEAPRQGKLSFENIKKMTIEERIKLPAIYFRIIKEFNYEDSFVFTEETISKNIKSIYIWGESGVGKSTLAKKLAGKHIKELKEKGFNNIKHIGDFWCGISDCKVAIYDDFRDSHMKPSEFINLIDYNIHIMNIKNGLKLNKYEYIVITSTQDPHFIYLNVTERDREPQKQWLRRLTIVNLLSINDIINYLYL